MKVIRDCLEGLCVSFFFLDISLIPINGDSSHISTTSKSMSGHGYHISLSDSPILDSCLSGLATNTYKFPLSVVAKWVCCLPFSWPTRICSTLPQRPTSELTIFIIIIHQILSFWWKSCLLAMRLLKNSEVTSHTISCKLSLLRSKIITRPSSQPKAANLLRNASCVMCTATGSQSKGIRLLLSGKVPWMW